jgi:hypothetical protein
VFLISGTPGIPRRILAAAFVALVALGSLAAPTSTAAAGPITVTITQAAVSLGATNLENVDVTGHFSGFTAPYHYVFSVLGVAKASGNASAADLTKRLVNNCSITTQSVTVTITDAAGVTGTMSATLNRSLCPAPPTANHAADHILAGPTITRSSFIDRLRAVNSPAYSSGSAIYTELLSTGVNPAFALGMFQAESASGTKGYARTTLNWGNMLYHSWQDVYGAVPYAPGNGYTYAKFPSWLAGLRAFTHLVVVYDGAGYVTVSQASAHWLGTYEGSTRHLQYLKNITTVMTLLPDDAVPKMTGLSAPAKVPGRFRINFSAKDNLGVTGYQVRARRGTHSWSAPVLAFGRSTVLSLQSGTWTIGVRATDAAGNWSAWRYIRVVVDASVPVMRELSAPLLVRSRDGSFVVTFRATDNKAVTRYLIKTRKGPTGTWSAVSTQAGRSRTFSNLGAGTWYIAVAARDAIGNETPWKEVKVVVPKDDRAFQFDLGTVRRHNAADFRGTDTSTSRAGAKMTVQFTGDRFYLIGTTGIGKGKMRVTIDGKSYIVDSGLHAGRRATSTHYRELLLSKWLSAGPHTVVITNLATAGRPVITLDAIGWR